MLSIPLPARAAAPPIEEAKAHYERGAALYDAGKYREAIDEFVASYDLSHRPAILFDLARAESKLGHEDKAIYYLEQCLAADPHGPDAASVRAELDARRQARAERQARERAQADADAARRQAEAERASAARLQREVEQHRAEAEHSRHVTRAAGLALGSGGLALVIGGIVCGVFASHDADTVSRGSGHFNGGPADAQNQGQALARAGIALDVIGGVAAAAGVGLITLSVVRKSTPVRAWLVPNGAGLAVAGSF